MVFLLVWAEEALSSHPAGNGGSGVSGLGALAGSCVWSSASPKSDTLISLSVRSISSSLPRGAAVLFYFVKCCMVPPFSFVLLVAAWLTQPNVTIPVSSVNNCKR